MNQKNQELAKQAGFYFYDMHDVDGVDIGESVEADSFEAVDKLVNLVVKECIEVLRSVPYNSPLIEFGEEIPFQYALKKHFGVE